MPTNELSRNLADALTKQMSLRPDAPAIHLPARDVSFRQLENLVWRTAAFLHRSGVKVGSVVALTFANELGVIVTMLATARIGATAFSIPMRTPTILRAEMAATANVQFLATDIISEENDDLPHLLIDLDLLANDPTPIDPAIRKEYPQAPWLIITGSGSTGRSKQIPVTHSVFNERFQLYSNNIPISPTDCVVSLIHANFSAAKEIYLRTLFAGASISLFDRAHTDLVDLCQRKNVSVLYSPVLHLEQMISRLQNTVTNAYGSLRALVPFGSVASDRLRQRIVETLSPNLHIRYGTNETGLATYASPQDVLSTPGTVGRPLSGVQVELFDSNGDTVPTGSVGQIRIRSPGTVNGYSDDGVATQRAFKDGWFLPGDLGKFTADGQLIFLGRSDQMMIMDGINIYPAEIETVVARHSAVSDVAAIPLHSVVHQDIPVCAVSLHPDKHVTERELLNFSFQRLGSRCPRRIIILEKLPRTEQGKLLLQQLRQLMAERLQSPIEPIDGH